MARSLIDFLEELDSNAKLKEAYLKDPVGTAQSYGLGDDDIELIKNQDWEKAKQMFESEGKPIKTHTY
ncbi:hypothetical protein [Paraglaciecola aestuariivivens]